MSPFQYAYRRNASTEMALRQTIDSLRNSTWPALVNFDLRRAFERVDCFNVLETLLNWNLHPRIDDSICKIANRISFKVETRQFPRRARSKPATTKLGVPQGSSLGPILFIIEVDSLLQLLEGNKIKASMYSDDLAMIFNWLPSEHQNCIHLRIQKAIDLSVEWCALRQFVINKDK